MKVLPIIFILIFYTCIFWGCSSVYHIQNFPSKEKFYQSLNNSVNDKDVEVYIKRDSVIYLNNDIEINNDTLIILNKKTKVEKFILLNAIKKIDYDYFQKASAHIELKDGEELEAEDIEISNGGMKFNNTKFLTIKSSISVKEIEKISYKNRWQGLVTGLLVGTVAGAAIGGFTHIIPVYENRPSLSPPYQRREYNTLYSFVIGTASGALIGAIIGWLIGYDYIYQF